MGLGLWQSRGIIGESSAFNKVPIGVRMLSTGMGGSR